MTGHDLVRHLALHPDDLDLEVIILGVNRPEMEGVERVEQLVTTGRGPYLAVKALDTEVRAERERYAGG